MMQQQEMNGTIGGGQGGIDEAQIRSRLEEVFGPYTGFVGLIQNFGKNSVHGIVREGARPLVYSRLNGSHRSARHQLSSASAGHLANGTSGNGSYASLDGPRVPSPQQCLQSMQSLVNSPPLEPPSGATFMNRDLRSLNPSSSTRSAPDEDTYKVKKRERNRDSSDTEPEKEKRKRARMEEDEKEKRCSRQEQRPASRLITRQSSEEQAIKDLFESRDEAPQEEEERMDTIATANEEDSTTNKPSTSAAAVEVRRTEGIQLNALPQLSPDSGVHSAENDSGETEESVGTNVVQKLEMFINGLSPQSQLSPLRSKPTDWQKVDKDNKKNGEEKKERKQREEEKDGEGEKKKDKEKDKIRHKLERAEKPAGVGEKEKEKRRKVEGKDADGAVAKRIKTGEQFTAKKVEDKNTERISVRKELMDVDDVRPGSSNAVMDKPIKDNKREETSSLGGAISLSSISPNLFKRLLNVGTKEGKLIGNKDEKENKHQVKKEVTTTEISASAGRSNDKDKAAATKERKEKSSRDRDEERGKERERKKEDSKREKSEKKSKQMIDVKKEAAEKLNFKESPIFRPSSSASLPEFECQFACSKPLRKEQIKLPPADNSPGQRLADFYQGIARQMKKAGDAESEKILRNLLYIESGLYFCLSARQTVDGPPPQPVASGQTPDSRSVAVNILKETNNMLLMVQSNIKSIDSSSAFGSHFANRLHVLNLLSMAVYNQQLFDLRADQSYRTFFHLQKIEDHFSTDTPLGSTSTAGQPAQQTPPSRTEKKDKEKGGDKEKPKAGGKPAAGISSSNTVHINTSDTTMVSVPRNSLLLLKQHMKQMNILLLANRQWQDAHTRNDQAGGEEDFIRMVESVSGHFCMNGPVETFATFLLTGINWLRAEHTAERHMAPPSSRDGICGTASSTPQSSKASR